MGYFLLFSSHFNRDAGIDNGRLSLNHLSKGVIGIWVAISSHSRGQNKEGFHARNSYIPPCYRLHGCNRYTVDINPLKMPDNSGVRGNFYRILPFEVTTDKGQKRGDFGIHKDAGAKGSHGCIVLDATRFQLFEKRILQINTGNNNYIPLFVQYS